MFDHLLESSHRDDSNKWSNIEFGQEIKELVKFILRILSGALGLLLKDGKCLGHLINILPMIISVICEF